MKLKYNEGSPAWFEGSTFIKYASPNDLRKYWGLITSDYYKINGTTEDGYDSVEVYGPVQDDWYLYFNQSNFFWKDSTGNIQRYLTLDEIKSMYDPTKKVQKIRKSKKSKKNVK